jgi:adenylate cyclase
MGACALPMPPWRSSCLLVALLWVGLTALAFTHGVWLSASLPILAAAPPAILFGAARLWFDRQRADRFAEESSTLRHFQPAGLAQRLAEDPDFLAQPVEQQAALVFIDLSGFTGLSETLSPDETREVLKGFHALVDEEAVRCHGLVASFMGDGAMIIFGRCRPASATRSGRIMGRSARPASAGTVTSTSRPSAIRSTWQAA